MYDIFLAGVWVLYASLLTEPIFIFVHNTLIKNAIYKTTKKPTGIIIIKPVIHETSIVILCCRGILC